MNTNSHRLSELDAYCNKVCYATNEVNFNWI